MFIRSLLAIPQAITDNFRWIAIGAAALLIVLAVGIYFLADSLAGKNGQNEQKEKIRA